MPRSEVILALLCAVLTSTVIAKGEDEERVVRLDPNASTQPVGPISMQADAFGVTPPIRDLPEVRGTLPPPVGPVRIQEKENNEIEVDRVIPGLGAGDRPFSDPLAELSRASARNPNVPNAMPGPALTFNGVLSADLLTTFLTTSMPPDTTGDVGPSHYVQATNIGVFRVFNKTGTALTATARISTLFTGLPATNKCRLRDNGDVVVNYDPLADRWLVSQFAIQDDGGDSTAPFYQCIAVSTSGDPTGSWFAYAFRGPNSNFPDYPHWGVWSDGYYLATHEFGSVSYIQGGFFAFNRDKMLVGDPTANYVYFSVASSFGHLPADIDGYMPPAAGTPEMFFGYNADEFGGTDSIVSYELVPNYTTPASSTFTTKPALAVNAFDPRSPTGRNDIEQPTPVIASHYLDALGSNVMFRVGYRNLGSIASPTHSYVMNWTVNVSGVNPTTNSNLYQAGIRWEELRRSGAGVMSVFDQGTHAPDAVSGTGRNRWMGSIAQDNNGNVAIGFSRSGPLATEFPDIVWAGRSGGQIAASTMNEGEATMFASTGFQQTTNGRWGDYSGMTIDPVDDCTFWYTTEYREAVNNGTGTNNPFKWSTRIGNFAFPSCTPQPKGQLAVTVTSCSTGLPISGAVVNLNPGGFARLTNASGTLVSNIVAAPGSYTASASKSGFSANTSTSIANASTTNINLCLSGATVVPTSASISSQACVANGLADPGETLSVSLGLQNTGGATLGNLVGTLQTSGGVIATGPAQSYGSLVAGGAAVFRTFTFAVNPNLLLGANVTLMLALTDGVTSLGTAQFTLASATTAGSASTFSYAGAVVPITDNNQNGVNASLVISGATSVIQDLNFIVQGTVSSATVGATTVGIDHSWIGDMRAVLTSPAGTPVTLWNLIDNTAAPPADGQCAANNIHQLTLDDASAGANVDASCPGTTNTGPLTGSRRPANPLSDFNGENPNGTWTLNVNDVAATDTGSIRNFGLIITPFASSCASKVWTGASSSDWNVAGNWSPSGVPIAGDSVVIPSTGVINEPSIITPNVTVTNLVLTGPRTLTINSGRLLTVTGSTLINGTVTILGNNAVAFSTPTLTNSTFNYAGAAAQVLSNLAYSNLTLNNAAGANLAANTSVDGVLTLSNGLLNALSNTLSLSCTATLGSAGASSYVIGTVKKDFCATGGFTFPNGTANGYSPMTSTVTTLTTNPSSLSSSATQTWQAQVLAAQSLKRYWTLTETGDLTANLSFNYLDPTDINGTEASYQLIRVAAGTPTIITPFTLNTGANSIATNAVTSFGDWTAGSFSTPGFEVGVITLPATTAGPNNLTHVTFPEPFPVTPVVIVQATDEDATDPQALRIVNVSSSGFDLIQVEAPGANCGAGCTGAGGVMTVHWLAAMEGSYRLPNSDVPVALNSLQPSAPGAGVLVKVGTLSTSASQRSTSFIAPAFNTWSVPSFASVVFPVSLNPTLNFTSAPVVLTTVQSWANEGANLNLGPTPALTGASQAWATTVASNINPLGSGFDVAIESSEVDDDDLAPAGFSNPETLGYVAIESPGSFSLTQFGNLSTVSLATGTGSATGTCASTSLTFPAVPVTANLRAFAGKQSRTDNPPTETDGGWLRRCSLGNAGTTVNVGMRIDEDMDLDAERTHATAESLGAAALSGDFVTTPVSLALLDARRLGRQLDVRFASATEVGHLGYRIWGRTEKTRPWTLLSDALIVSVGGDAMRGRNYQRIVDAPGVAYVRIEEVDLLGRSRFHPSVDVDAPVGSEASAEPLDWAAINRANAGVALLRIAGSNQAEAMVKVEGIQRVRFEDLLAAGWTGAGSALDAIAVSEAGVAVARLVACNDASSTFGTGCYVEWLGKPRESLYGAEHAYRISVDRALARPVGGGALLNAGGAAGSSPRVLASELVVAPNRAYSFSAPGADPWFDERIVATTQATEITRNFTLPERATGSVTMRVMLWGGLDFTGSNPDHSVQVQVNGNVLASQRFDGFSARTLQFAVPEAHLSSNNTLTVKVMADTGYTADVVLLDGFSVQYSRSSRASEGVLSSATLTSNSGSDRLFGGNFETVAGFAITGTQGPSVLWSEMDGALYRDQISSDVVLNNRVTGLRLAPVVALAKPALRTVIDPAVLSAGVDYLIVTHPLFEGELGALISLQQARGLSVRVLRTDAIYAALSNGEPTPQAIAQAIEAIKPRFVLLVGGDSYDYHDYLQLGSRSYVPTFYRNADAIVRFAATDLPFVDSNADGAPERALGRIPARTVDELRTAVDSIVARAALPAVSYFATAGSSASHEHFASDSRAILSYLRQGQPKTFALSDELGLGTARAHSIAALSGSADWINYLGHSSPNRWAFQNLLDTSQLAGISRTGAPAIVSQWGCWSSYFVLPDQDTMSHALMLRANHLAAAVIGSTSLAEDASHLALATRLFDLVEDGRFGQVPMSPVNTLGEALMAAKRDVAEHAREHVESNYSITLFGDPAQGLR